MKITVIGSGTGIPLGFRASPSLVLSAGRQIYVLDLGPGTLRELARRGISHERISGVFITHFHPDHCADLVHLLFATRHPPVLGKRTPFFIAGPGGLKPLLTSLGHAYGKWIQLPEDLLTLVELEPGIDIVDLCPQLTIRTVPTGHTPQSLAYKFQALDGKALVYTGDTVYSRELIDLAKGADLLITECSFPDEMPVEGHLTPSRAGDLAREAGAKKLLLCHFYPEATSHQVALQCRARYEGELIVSTDGLDVYL